MDIIDRRFAAENAHAVHATLDTYTDDIVWDDVTHADAPFHGKESVRVVYSPILEAIPDVLVDSVKRFTEEGGGTLSMSRFWPAISMGSGLG